jgi:DNA-binding MarR family transcriptional regulator
MNDKGPVTVAGDTADAVRSATASSPPRSHEQRHHSPAAGLLAPQPEASEASRLAARFRLAIGRLHRQLNQHLTHNLTLSQLSALASIERHGPIRIGDLATHERVAAATLSRIVANMEAQGLIARHPDPEDARACRLLLTPAGATELAKLRCAHTRLLGELLTELTPDQADALATALPVLEILVERLSRQPRPGPGAA